MRASAICVCWIVLVFEMSSGRTASRHQSGAGLMPGRTRIWGSISPKYPPYAEPSWIICRQTSHSALHLVLQDFRGSAGRGPARTRQAVFKSARLKAGVERGRKAPRLPGGRAPLLEGSPVRKSGRRSHGTGRPHPHQALKARTPFRKDVNSFSLPRPKKVSACQKPDCSSLMSATSWPLPISKSFT